MTLISTSSLCSKVGAYNYICKLTLLSRWTCLPYNSMLIGSVGSVAHNQQERAELCSRLLLDLAVWGSFVGIDTQRGTGTVVQLHVYFLVVADETSNFAVILSVHYGFILVLKKLREYP